MPQIFLNNFQSQFIADVRAAPQSNNPATELDYGILRVSDGAAGTLLNPPAGDWYVLTAFKRSGSLESDYEIMRVTAVDNSVVGECRLTVQRGQEGMAPQAYARGDLLECRLTAGGMGEHVQTTDPRMSNSRTPGGPAGGVLSGQYPNPQFAQAMATAADLACKVDKVAGKGLSANDFTNTQVAKLGGVAEQATKNATDAQLRDRASHTGTQPIASVAGLQTALDSKPTLIEGKLDPSVIPNTGGDGLPIGSLHMGTKKPTAGLWLECGHVYLQSSYTELYAELGLLPDDAETTTGAMPTTVVDGTTVRGVVFGAGIFVAVADNGTAVSTSIDGKAWQSRTMPIAASWASVTYGGGRFVAVAKGGTQTAWSTNGINWVAGGALPASGDWLAVIHANGVFVALCANTAIAATSADGVTWTQRVLPSSTTWKAIAFGAGLFVAISGTNVAGTGTAFATSPDGVTWTARTITGATTWNSIAYSATLGLFAIVGAASGTSTGVISTSPDGIAWTSRSTSTNANYGLVVSSPTGFYAIASASTSTSVAGIASVNGTTWTVRSMGSYNGASYSCVAYGLGIFVFHNVDASTRLTWVPESIITAAIVAITAYAFIDLVWSNIFNLNGRFVAICGNAVIAESSAGVTWELRWIPILGANIADICYAANLYVAVGNSGFCYTSPDLSNWTSRSMPGSNVNWRSICYGAGIFVAAGQSTPFFSYSADGIAWSAGTAASIITTAISVAYGAGKFLATSNGAAILSSVDGITFAFDPSAKRIVGTNGVIRFLNERFVVAIGSSASSAYVISSVDGIEWTVSTIGILGVITDISYGDGVYCVLMQQTNIATSTDLSNWKIKPAANFPASFSGIAFCAEKFLMVTGIATTKNMSSILPATSYSRTTQFYVPKGVVVPQGMKQWIRAK